MKNRADESLIDQPLEGALKCGHSWHYGTPRTHVGDIICWYCKQQHSVYDQEFYDKLGHIPEPGPKGSLKPTPQTPR